MLKHPLNLCRQRKACDKMMAVNQKSRPCFSLMIKNKKGENEKRRTSLT